MIRPLQVVLRVRARDQDRRHKCNPPVSTTHSTAPNNINLHNQIYQGRQHFLHAAPSVAPYLNPGQFGGGSLKSLGIALTCFPPSTLPFPFVTSPVS